MKQTIKRILIVIELESYMKVNQLKHSISIENTTENEFPLAQWVTLLIWKTFRMKWNKILLGRSKCFWRASHELLTFNTNEMAIYLRAMHFIQ